MGHCVSGFSREAGCTFPRLEGPSLQVQADGTRSGLSPEAGGDPRPSPAGGHKPSVRSPPGSGLGEAPRGRSARSTPLPGGTARTARPEMPSQTGSVFDPTSGRLWPRTWTLSVNRRPLVHGAVSTVRQVWALFAPCPAPAAQTAPQVRGCASVLVWFPRGPRGCSLTSLGGAGGAAFLASTWSAVRAAPRASESAEC